MANCKYLFTLLICFFFVTSYSQAVSIAVVQCNAKIDPIGVDALPFFSWQLSSVKRSVTQQSYQIIISDNPSKGRNNNTWNSGLQVSGQSIHVTYKGKSLHPATKYYWWVQVTDNKGNVSLWSKTAVFTTGLFTEKDWSQAKWIGYEEMPDSLHTTPGVHSPDAKKMLGDKLKQRTIVPLFRKTFPVVKKVLNATVFISGLGQYEMSINGQKVGTSFLAPGWTDYNKRVFYNTYDVTILLKNGQNAIGVIVGNGFFNINRERYYKLAIAYGYPMMICKLLVTYDDGTSAVIISDKSWKTTPSPITFTSIYGGEDYNAGLEQQGWDNTLFNDAAWKSAVLVSSPKGALKEEMDYPVTVNEILTVKTISKPKDSVYIYDFGQNLSGIVELKVKGVKGQVVKLSPGELLSDLQLVNQNATGKPCYFSYTLKGDGVETWRPRFSYTGFRYIQVEGGVPDTTSSVAGFARIISIQSLHTRNSSPAAGSFECSNQLFNQVNQLIKWAIKSNIQSVATDCPHREKLGWLEEDYLMGGSIHDNYDIYHLYKKIVYDMMDAQTKEGLIPDIAPEYAFFDDHGFGFRDSPEWGSASVILPWLIYTWYGDKELLKEAYPMMKRYTAYLKSKSVNSILDYGLGDWYDLGPLHPGVAQLTPKALTATAIWYYDTQLLHKMAVLLNNEKDANELNQEAAEIKKSFNAKFFSVKDKIYSTGSQTSMAMPLCVGLVDEPYKTAVFKNLVDSITASGKKLTAGDIGYHFLVQALQQGGASQLLYDMNDRDDVPGYGYQLKKGATSLTESWQALKGVSNNHLMLGHIMEWFYNGLAGIDQSDSSVAYQQIVIKPELVGDITYVKGSYQSVYGTIKSEWKAGKREFSLAISVPVNTTAIVYLPASVDNHIFEGGVSIDHSSDIKRVGYKEGRTIVKIGSGDYHFSVK